MKLSEKLRHLRAVEGELRGLGRPLTKAEVARAMRAELDAGLSEAYLSQLESGRRRHLTAPTRGLLARFFKVHPGYLVDDPAGYETTILTQALEPRGGLGAWLLDRAEELRDDPALYHLFLRLGRSPSPRDTLLLLDAILNEAPERPEMLSYPATS
ncbi:MAG TPA: helix-turn-helix transcriptional regulator [Chloroflexota bacterium]|nr:helix-turn-helix transcriptional regulator [Chloroflexota bacterium]